MQFSVTFRHMDASEAVRNYAREKIDKIKKYVPDPIFAHFTVGTNRGYQHTADVHIQLHNGLAIKGSETSEDMYSSIDLVMDKVERQVRRYKEKIRHHKVKEGGLSELWEQIIEPTVGEDATPTTGANGANGHAAEAKPAAAKTPAPQITKREKITVPTLRADEAVMQLDLAHKQFLVFRNAESGVVNVVYRRDDGNYGLIETGGG
jgi:putative sigma-54 modulation protein